MNEFKLMCKVTEKTEFSNKIIIDERTADKLPKYESIILNRYWG